MKMMVINTIRVAAIIVSILAGIVYGVFRVTDFVTDIKGIGQGFEVAIVLLIGMVVLGLSILFKYTDHNRGKDQGDSNCKTNGNKNNVQWWNKPWALLLMGFIPLVIVLVFWGIGVILFLLSWQPDTWEEERFRFWMWGLVIALGYGHVYSWACVSALRLWLHVPLGSPPPRYSSISVKMDASIAMESNPSLPAKITIPTAAKRSSPEDVIPAWIIGCVERLLFTLLVGFDVPGLSTAMIGWIPAKMAVTWMTREQEGATRAYTGLIGTVVSLIFALLGGLIVRWALLQ